MTYVIAEIGPNHNGSRAAAVEMIERLARAGVDAIKFQLTKPENTYSSDAVKADYQKRHDDAPSPLEMSIRYQLAFEDHYVLSQACRENGVDYLCSAFEMDSLQFLAENIVMPYFKIPSGEIHSVDLLEYMARDGRPILMSTGAATFEDIELGIQVLAENGAGKITLLHCVSNYPAPAADANLKLIPELARRFGRAVGYSDHTLGNDCAVAAVALGAAVIEKHVTLDRDAPGPDHQASATIEDFESLVHSIRAVGSALGGSEKTFSQAELRIQKLIRKSVVARHDLLAGTRLAAGDLCFKRPGTGISPLKRDLVIGKVLRRDVSYNRVIDSDDIVW